MTTGDWLQVSVGLLGVVMTVVLGILVFRLESRERRAHRLAEKLEHDEKKSDDRRLAAQQASERREAEARAVRREQNVESYRRVIELLRNADRVFKAVQERPHRIRDVYALGNRELAKSISGWGERFPQFASELENVAISLEFLINNSFPGVPEVGGGESSGRLATEEFVRDALANWPKQNQMATRGRAFVLTAQEAVEKQWGT